MIEITGVDLKRFAKKVYQLSEPTNRQSSADPMSDTSMGLVLKTGGMRNWKKYVLDMHIVQGRACNMTVFENDQGRWFIQDTWQGHTQQQLHELLEHCGITQSNNNKGNQSHPSAHTASAPAPNSGQQNADNSAPEAGPAEAGDESERQ